MSSLALIAKTSKPLEKFLLKSNTKKAIALKSLRLNCSDITQVEGTVMQIIYNKYMIVSTQITDTEIFAFIAVLIFKLLRPKVLFINKNDNRNC